MSRLVGGAETLNGLAPHPHVVVKNQEEYLSCEGPLLGVCGPSSTLGSSALDFSDRKRSPTTFGCKNQLIIVSEWDRRWLNFQALSLKGSCTNLLISGFTYSEIQNWDSISNGIIQVRTKLSDLGRELERELLPDKSASRSHCFFLELSALSLCRCKLEPYLSLHQPC